MSSLVLNLIGAFFTISAQQWTRRIPLPSHVTVQEAVRLRQLRYGGLVRWKVPDIISLLPVVIQISVMLFLCGMLLLLDTLNTTVARAFCILSGILLVFWAVMTLLPLVFFDCPYKSPAIPVTLAAIRICIPPLAAVLILVLVYVLEVATSPMAYAYGLGLPVVIVVIAVRLLSTNGKLDITPITHQPLYLRTIGHFQAASAVIRETVQLWIIHEVVEFYQSLSYPVWFWDDHELRSITRRAAALDGAAFSDAPFTVPKDSLDSIHEKCLEDLPPGHRPEVGLQCVTVQLAMRQQAVFRILRARSVVLFTQNVEAFHEALYELRATLWDCLPKEWTVSGAGFFDNNDGTKPYAYDNWIADILSFLYRSMLVHPPANAAVDAAFARDFTETLCAIRRTQIPNGRALVDRSSLRLPVTLLFGCCVQHGPVRIDGASDII